MGEDWNEKLEEENPLVNLSATPMDTAELSRQP